MIPGRNLIRPAAHHRLCVSRPRIGPGFDDVLRHGVIAVEGRQIEKVGRRVRQPHLQGLIIQGSDAHFVSSGLPVKIRFGLINTEQHVGVFRSDVRIQHPLPRVFNILGRNRRAVAPTDAVAQIKRIYLAVRRNLPRSGQSRLRHVMVVQTGQPLENLQFHVAFWQGRRHRRIQARRLGFQYIAHCIGTGRSPAAPAGHQQQPQADSRQYPFHHRPSSATAWQATYRSGRTFRHRGSSRRHRSDA